MSLFGGKRVLVLAIVAGLVTSLLVWSYMQKAGQAEKPEPTVSVMVAAQDVPARTKFTQEMFEWKKIPVSAKHPLAVTQPDQVVGKIVKLPITAGEQVLSNQFFAERAESGLAFIVPPGKRAVSVAVSEVIGSGGMIVPGDKVDVVGVFDAKPFGQDAAIYVLQDVDVLAVAQQMEGEQPPVTDSALSQATQPLGIGSKPQASPASQVAPQPQPTAHTATLAVAPEEALRLILAEERGKIRLVLRPANDDTTHSMPAVFLKGLEPATGGQSHQSQPASSDTTAAAAAAPSANGGGSQPASPNTTTAAAPQNAGGTQP